MNYSSMLNINTDFFASPRFRICRHILLQCVLIAMTINIALDGEAKLCQQVTDVVVWFCYYLLVSSVVYVNLYMLAPRYLIKEQYKKYAIAVVLLTMALLLGITVLQSAIFNLRPIKEIPGSYLILLNFISSSLAISLLIAGTSTFLLLRHWVGYNRRIDELEATTLQSELIHLKQQINPHFLFNMLNNANVLIRKNPQDASQVLFKLEDLLRYQINDSSKEKVSLSSDIHFLNDFLNLEKVRRDRFEYTITIEGDIDPIYLPPLLFIPFVENAVKHNPDSEHVSYTNLIFRVQNNELQFQCINSKPANQRDFNLIKTGGLGLKNIHRRLELLYPDKHSLKVEENETCYKVSLILTL